MAWVMPRHDPHHTGDEKILMISLIVESHLGIKKLGDVGGTRIGKELAGEKDGIPYDGIKILPGSELKKYVDFLSSEGTGARSTGAELSARGGENTSGRFGEKEGMVSKVGLHELNWEYREIGGDVIHISP